MNENNEIKEKALFQEQVNSEKQSELAACQSQLQEYKDKYVRVIADFENFKKRQEKDRLSWNFTAQAELLRGFLGIVDNFDRALSEQQKESNPQLQSWIQGFALIGTELHKYLEKIGVQEITETREFNPEIHEAIMQVSSDEHKSGEIVSVLQKGYRFKGEVLRPAKVSLAA